MLFLFCGSNYYIIDDYNKRDVIAGPTAISDTWPELVKYSAAGADGTSEPFSKKLDAAYFETSSQRLVFFKGNTCVIADYSGGQTSTWESGLINEYFQVGATPVAGMFDASIDGATVGRASNPNVQNTVFLVKQGQYAAGQSTAPRKGSPVKLTHQSTMTQAGWPIPTDDNTTVAAEYVYPPNSQTWESTLFTTTNKGSQSAGDYLVRFYTSTSENAAPNKLWPSFNGVPSTLRSGWIPTCARPAPAILAAAILAPAILATVIRVPAILATVILATVILAAAILATVILAAAILATPVRCAANCR
jgi:hypothetical protein